MVTLTFKGERGKYILPKNTFQSASHFSALLRYYFLCSSHSSFAESKCLSLKLKEKHLSTKKGLVRPFCFFAFLLLLYRFRRGLSAQ